MYKKIAFVLSLMAFAFLAHAQPGPNEAHSPRDGMERRADVKTDGTKKDTRTDPRSTAAGAPVGPKLTYCPGEFAFCGSSTCKPTGRKIEVKVDGGNKTKLYDESDCKCPIIPKKIAVQNGAKLGGLAALEEGNMKGSCDRPGPGKIWSLMGLNIDVFPQESTSPPFQMAQVGYQSCPVGTVGSNCWSFACKIDPKPINGAKVATCYCAISDAYLGHHIDPSSYISTGAGSHYSNPSQACSQYPVSSEDGSVTWTGEAQ